MVEGVVLDDGVVEMEEGAVGLGYGSDFSVFG